MMESALHPLQSQVRTSSGEVKSELRHRADTFASNGLIVPFSINGKQHSIVAVNGRAIIQAKINGTVVPMYLHSGISQQSKAAGFIPYAGMHVGAQDQNGQFQTYQMKGGGKWVDLGHKDINTGEPVLKLNGAYNTYGDNLTPNGKSESEGWGHADLNAARKQITGLFFHNTQIPTGQSMKRFISPQSFPDILHIDSDNPQHYDVARQIAYQQAFNMPKTFSTRGEFWGREELMQARALRARSHAILSSITDNVAHPTDGRSAQTAMFQRIRQLLDTTFRRSMIMKPNPFSLQLSLLAKGRGEDSRQASSLYGASQYSERDFPTGQMTDAGGFFGYPEAETGTDGISHIGVFGEKRHILVESSRANPPRHDQTHINWVHIEPGTEIKPHHVTEIFQALYDAGYTKPMTWRALKDNDERDSDRSPSRRDRFFRPLAAQWAEFVAARQGKSAEFRRSMIMKPNPFPLQLRLLAKGRGEDARQAHSKLRASQFSEDAFPTGQMTGRASHVGVFGEKRHILVESTQKYRNQTHISWVHIEPGTKVEPHHVTQIFEALHNAGYRGPMTWGAIKDNDEKFRSVSRRDRFFRPLAAQWDQFVAAQQGKSAAPAAPAPPPEAPLRNSFYDDIPLHEIYNRLSKAEEPTREDNEKIVWLDNDRPIENPQKQMLLDRLTQYHAGLARPFEMLSSHMYGNHVFDLGDPEQTKETNYQHYANALRAHIKHKGTIEDRMDDQEVQEALEKPIEQFARQQWFPANIAAHMMGKKVASHVLGNGHPDIRKVGHAARNAGMKYIWDLEEQGETFSPEKHLSPLHQIMLNACAEGTPNAMTGKPVVYSEPPKPGSLGALKQKAPDISKSYKRNEKMYPYDDVPLHEIYNQLSKAYKTPAWQRAEGQNPKGGLNAKGRASAKAEGHNLKAPVKSGDNPRRASFLARMGNSPGPEYDEHGKPTRLLLSLQAWGASSKADARKKAKAISARLKAKE